MNNEAMTALKSHKAVLQKMVEVKEMNIKSLEQELSDDKEALSRLISRMEDLEKAIDEQSK